MTALSPPASIASRWQGILLSLPALVLSAWAYWPITANYFHSDDFMHLYLIADGRLGEFLVTPHGGHLLVVRNALMALTHAVFGLDPRGYFWIALLTHLVNVALLFAIVARLAGSRRLACAAAALWGVSPLNVDALGWYSVYGQVVLGTTLLFVLWRLARAMDPGVPWSRREIVACYLAVLIGATCFGTGIGLALAFAAGIAICLPGASHRAARRSFASLLVAVPALYFVVRVLHRAVVTQPVDVAANAWPAVSAMPVALAMTLHMMAFGAARGMAGPWFPDAPYPGAALHVLAGVYTLAIAAGLWRGGAVARRAIVTCLLLAVSGYGIIAAGRAIAAHGDPWVLIVLGLAARYHYAPLLPLIIAGCTALAAIAGRRPMIPPRAANAALLVWLGAVAAGVYAWPPPIDHFDDERQQLAAFQALVRQRVAASPPGATATVVNQPMYPVNAHARMTTFPGWAGLFVVYFPTNDVDGRAVRFVVRGANLIDAARSRPGTRTAELLISPAEARLGGGR